MTQHFFLMTCHFLNYRITITSFHKIFQQKDPVEIKFKIITRLQIKSHSLSNFCFTNAQRRERERRGRERLTDLSLLRHRLPLLVTAASCLQATRPSQPLVSSCQHSHQYLTLFEKPLNLKYCYFLSSPMCCQVGCSIHRSISIY